MTHQKCQPCELCSKELRARTSPVFHIPLSSQPSGPMQDLPQMIEKKTGPDYLKKHVVTRCEKCTHVVWPQFSWCEIPCPRAGASPVGWQLCVFCGAMRCDALPVIAKPLLPGPPPSEPPPPEPPPPFQPCICEYPGGERSWMTAQSDAARRAPRSLTLHECMSAR